MRKKTFLIVEDEPGIAYLLDLVLRDQFKTEEGEPEVEICETLECAFLYLQERKQDERPRLIILDLQLPPNQSEFATLQALPLLKAMARCPVIIHTGKSDPGLHKQATAAGADDFAQKGSNFDDLISRIYIAEGRHERARQEELARRAALEEHHELERRKCEEKHAVEQRECEQRAASANDERLIRDSNREVAEFRLACFSVVAQMVLQIGNDVAANASTRAIVAGALIVVGGRVAEWLASEKEKLKRIN